MRKFLVLYRAETSAREQMAKVSPEQAKEGMELWNSWAKQNGSAIVDLGSPLGNSVELTSSGKTHGDEEIAGFSIVEGDSLEEVSKRFARHPHFHTPGKSAIQIVEFLDLPGNVETIGRAQGLALRSDRATFRACAARRTERNSNG